MTRDTSISLGDHFTDFVDRQIESGRYESVSDVVRAALRLLEARETSVNGSPAPAIAGEGSGPAAAFDSTASAGRMRPKHVERNFRQSDIARILRAAKQIGAPYVQLQVGDTVVKVALTGDGYPEFKQAKRRDFVL